MKFRIPAILSWFNNHAGGYADTPGNEPTQSRETLLLFLPGKLLLLLLFIRSFIYYEGMIIRVLK